MSNDTTTTKRALKPLEVGVGAGAAVVTAFASSYLGTAGTLTGAALASVVGTVSTSVLRTSADHSAERLRQTTARIRQTRASAMPAPTDTHPVETGTTGTTGDQPAAQLLGAPDPDPTAERTRTLSRPRWVMLGVGAVIAFAVSLVAITGIESAAGKPLAGLVGKESGGGTTLGRATGTDTGSSTGDDAPDPTPTPTPAPTTSGQPSQTTTENPSGSPTSGPTPTGPTPTPSATTGSAPAPTRAPNGSPVPRTSATP
jgi:hypothetical protein